MARRNNKPKHKGKQNHYNEEQFEDKPTQTGSIKEQLDVMIGEIRVKPKTENQKKFLKMINDHEIVICSGPAGTGKTFLAVSEALKLLKNDEVPYKKIVLLKSVTPLKGEELGFLKGSLDEKLSPFMYSFMANFYKLIGNRLSDNLKEQGFIEVLPISFIRGLSIDNSLIIVDEAQNISLDNMESILTRIGYNSKMIIIGDTKQIDIKNKKESSLFTITEKFKDINGFGVMAFEKTDQVRNPLINQIEDIFDKIKEEYT